MVIYLQLLDGVAV